MRVLVPATSANLGPGFDCLGLAWRLFDEIEFTPAEVFSVSGCPAEYANEDNLCLCAYKAAFSHCGVEPIPVAVLFTQNDIPLSRGLGSSAALIVAGVRAANELGQLSLSNEEMFHIAAELEGHPDNVAPALFGGLTASYRAADDCYACTPLELSKKLHFAALIPDFHLSTKLARSVLPRSYSRDDAVRNTSCAALLVRALELGDIALLREAQKDRLHEPYRKELIPGYESVQKLVEANPKLAFCISGAGPALLCISDSAAELRAVQRSIKKILPSWKFKLLKVQK